MSGASGKVRVGLIGAGMMANGVHYPSLAEMDDVEMVALCDLDEDRLEQTAERFGIESRYRSYRRMLAQEDVDAVYVLMPPHILFNIVVDCIEAGRHVFIEKPPTISTFQLGSLCRLTEKHGLIGMVGFNRRYIPMMRWARRKMEEATTINQVVATFFKDESAVYYGGALDVIGCDAIHAVDTLRWLASGDVLDVASVITMNDDVVPNAWNAVVYFDSGVVGVLMTNWATGGRSHTFQLHGRGASAVLDPNSKGAIRRGDDTETVDAHEIAGSDENYKFYGFFDENRHFIDCVKSGAEPLTSFADGLKTMELVDMIRACTIVSPSAGTMK